MIRIIKGDPLSADVLALVDTHPLGIAAHLLRAAGLSLAVGGLLVMVASMITASAPAASATVVGAAGTILAGATLAHQANELFRRVINTHLRKSDPAAVR